MISLADFFNAATHSTFFTPTANDKSLTYLAAIFGPLVPGGQAGIYIVPSLLDGLTKVILFLAVVVILYMIVVGTMMTSHEGEFMKKWHGSFAPIRAVFGLGMLIPGPAAGYSVLQYIVMQIIVLGIGLADYTWSLSAAIQQSGMSGPISLPKAEVQGKLSLLFQGLVCEATASLKYTYPVTCITDAASRNVCPFGTNRGYYCASPDYAPSEYCQNTLKNIPDTTSGGYTFSSNTTNAAAFSLTDTYSLGPHSDCGYMKHCNPNDTSPTAPCAPGKQNTVACLVCQQQLQAFTANQTGILDPDHGLPAYARVYAELDYEYQHYWYETQKVEKDIQAWVDQMAECAARSRGGNTNTPSGAGGISGNPTTPGGGLGPPPSCTARPPDLPPIPDWIQAYCDKHGIPRTAHCDSTNLPAPLPATSGVSQFIVNELYAGGMASVAQSKFGLTLTDTQFMNTFVDNYTSILSQAVSTYLINFARNLAVNGGQYVDLGWLYGGTYYYKLAKMDANNLDQVWPTLEIPPSDPAASNPRIKLSEYMNNYTAASYLVKSATGAVAGSANPSGSGVSSFPGGDAAAATVANAGNAVSDVMQQNAADIQSKVPPLFAISRAGQGILIAVEVSWTAWFIATTTLGFLGGLSVFGLGTGIVNPLGPAEVLIYMVLVPFMYALFGILLSIGATLAVYIPLIPFMIFAFGAIGWFISVIEAIIAAPFVGLGIIVPGGHEIFGRAEQAFMMLLGVALRPTFMVIGLWAANELSKSVVTFITDAFWNPNWGVYSVLVKGDPLTTIIYTAAYIGLLAVILNKTFALIHIIPDRVLTWIGAQAGQSDTGAEAISETKGRVEGASARTSEFGGEHAQRVSTVGKKQHKALDKEHSAQLSAGNSPDSGAGGGGEGGGGTGGGGEGGGGGGGRGFQRTSAFDATRRGIKKRLGLDTPEIPKSGGDNKGSDTKGDDKGSKGGGTPPKEEE